MKTLLVAAIQHLQQCYGSNTTTTLRQDHRATHIHSRVLVQALERQARAVTKRFANLRAEPGDLVGIAFRRIIETKTAFNGESDTQAQSWVNTLCTNLARDAYRKQKRERMLVSSTPEIEQYLEEPQAEQPWGDLNSTAIIAEYRDLFARAKLSPKLTFALADAYGLIPMGPLSSEAERASQLRIKRNALQARRSRFRKQLGDALSHSSLSQRDGALLRVLLGGSPRATQNRQRATLNP